MKKKYYHSNYMEEFMATSVEKREVQIQAVMVFVLDDEKNILVLRRVDNEQWEPVKGGIYDNEKQSVAALREMKEETGLEPIRALEFLKSVDDEFVNGEGKKLKVRGYVFCGYVAGVRPAVSLSKEENDRDHDDYQWIPYRDIFSKTLFPPIANNIVREYEDILKKEE